MGWKALSFAMCIVGYVTKVPLVNGIEDALRVPNRHREGCSFDHAMDKTTTRFMDTSLNNWRSFHTNGKIWLLGNSVAWVIGPAAWCCDWRKRKPRPLVPLWDTIGLACQCAFTNTMKSILVVDKELWTCCRSYGFNYCWLELNQLRSLLFIIDWQSRR